MSEGFDPSRHLSKLSGKDYLEVKWRLVWFRDREPHGSIRTELVEHDPGKYALFKATVKTDGHIHEGEGGEATGYGSETASDFRDYIEKAETKAIGRALAALGFGTQFTDEFDFGAAIGRVVDSPVQRPSGPVSQPQGPSRNTRPPQPNGSPPQQARQESGAGVKMASAKQIGYLRVLANQAWSKEEDPEARLHGQVHARFSLEHLNDLSSAQASQMIEWFNAQDFIDETARPQPRVDPVEAGQVNYAMAEPNWLSQAPPLGEPGDDRYS